MDRIGGNLVLQSREIAVEYLPCCYLVLGLRSILLIKLSKREWQNMRTLSASLFIAPTFTWRHVLVDL